MATVGDVLLEPEIGWSRINYDNSNLIYTGSWRKPSGDNDFIMGDPNATVSFKFYGTGFRYISLTGSDTSSNVKIIIDGIETVISTNGNMANGGTKPKYTILFEKVGLAEGVHEVSFKNATSGTELMLSSIFDINGAIMKSIGSQLLEPEDGWKRIDDTDHRILYAGAMGSQWYQNTQNEVMKTYKNTLTYVSANTTSAKIKFDFIGSKLRLLCATYYDYTTAVIVKIDGVEIGTFSQRDTTNNTPSGDNAGSKLLFEKTGLEFKRHSVEIIKKDSGLFNLDAIDIDDNGDLVTILYTKSLQPEKGWNRFDDYDPRIKYSTTGNWQVSNGATSAYDKYYNRTFHYKHSSQGTEWVDYTFKFYGSKLRIIGSVTKDYGYNTVTIDGKEIGRIEYAKEEPYYADAEQRILFEVTDLPLGIHTVKVSGQYSNIDAIDTDGELVYDIGSPITTVDSSWVRYDDTDTRIIFNGLFTQNIASTGYYNNTIRYVSDLDKDKEGYNAIKTIKFKFYGTKLRIIGVLSTPYYDTNASVKIDGENIGTINFVNSVVVKQALVFQKYGLEPKVHEVEISGIILNFDAVDIGKNGYLVHPYLTERTRIEDMKIGDCIPCQYMNRNGGLDFGAFKDIGKGDATTIPIGNNTIGIYGTFYLIKVANGLLIADRNVRTNVNWQNMNIAGYVEGKPLRVGTDFGPTTTGYISIPYSTTMNPDTITIRSIASHNNWNAITDAQDIISNFENQGYGFEVDGVKKIFMFQAYINTKYYSASVPLSSITSGTHTFVGSFDGRYLKLYIDGELKSTTDVGTNGNKIKYVYSVPTLIGANPGTDGKPVTNAGFHFKGKIFETAVWSNYALTDEEVKNLPKRLTGRENRITHLWDGNMDLSYNSSNTFYDIVSWLDAKGYNGTRFNVLDNDLSENIVVRVPSGGTEFMASNGNGSITDNGLGAYPANNEWDRYVVNFPTKFIQNGGTLEKIWNIDGATESYTSDITKNNVVLSNGTKVEGTKYRTSRGLKNIKGMNIGMWNTTATNIGFRPVFEYTEK